MAKFTEQNDFAPNANMSLILICLRSHMVSETCDRMAVHPRGKPVELNNKLG
jgi:ABC-type dipeptide/oligopeptide/nickel transport system ATPase component